MLLKYIELKCIITIENRLKMELRYSNYSIVLGEGNIRLSYIKNVSCHM